MLHGGISGLPEPREAPVGTLHVSEPDVGARGGVAESSVSRGNRGWPQPGTTRPRSRLRATQSDRGRRRQDTGRGARAWPRPPSVGETGPARPGTTRRRVRKRPTPGALSCSQPGSATVWGGHLRVQAGWTERSRRGQRPDSREVRASARLGHGRGVASRGSGRPDRALETGPRSRLARGTSVAIGSPARADPGRVQASPSSARPGASLTAAGRGSTPH